MRNDKIATITSTIKVRLGEISILLQEVLEEGSALSDLNERQFVARSVSAAESKLKPVVDIMDVLHWSFSPQGGFHGEGKGDSDS